MRTLLLTLLITLTAAACDDDDAAAGSDVATPDAGAPDVTAAPESLDDPDAPGLPDEGTADASPTPGAEIPDAVGPDTTGPDTATDTAEPPPACDAPPALPPLGDHDWRHTSTQLLTVTQGGPNHRGQDVVVGAGQPQHLVGKFAYGVFDKDLKDEDVEVFVMGDPPCGDWRSLGVFCTSEDGEYGVMYGVEDDGGRVFVEIPAGEALPVGRHPVRMRVLGDGSVAHFDLIVVEPSTDAVVFDIDATLSTSDLELILEVASDVFFGDFVPGMREGAPAVVQAWADKGYLVVYLTGRPDLLRTASEGWLVKRGLPDGALHLTDTNGEVLPTWDGVGKYKAAFLTGLQAKGVDLHAAYGNAPTDIQAYEAAGVPKDVSFIVGDHAGEDDTVAVDGYPSHLPTAEAFPPAADPAPPAWGWAW